MDHANQTRRTTVLRRLMSALVHRDILRRHANPVAKGVPLRICGTARCPLLKKYGWLNGLQTVGKMISLKGGDHIRYDIFTVK
jgi:hypothetical protein